MREIREIQDLKPYPAYRDSGVPWLGQIPAQWEVLPALAAYKPKLVKNTGMIEKTVLSLSYGRIIVKPEEKLRGLVPESFETYQIVEPGNIIVRTTDLQNDQTSLRVGYSRFRGIITAAYMCLETKGRVLSKFGYQFLNAYDLLKIIYGFGSGLRQNLDFSHIKRMPVLAPPRTDQSAIVHFLDHVDRAIGRYVRSKKKLVALLNEQKQAIIHRAVTRGVDQNVRLKNSGVEWLGDVSEHWEVLRARYLFREVDRRSVAGEETHLSMSQKLGLVPSAFVEQRTLVSESYAGGKLCDEDDLVLNRLKAHLGVFAVAKQSGVISPDYTVLRRTRPMMVQYFEHILRSPAFRHELRVRAKGIVEGFWRLYTDDFYDIRLPVPPVHEQGKIVGAIDAQTRSIRETVERAEREIDLFREYRTRLITDVVTGKLDVREAAARLPAEAEEQDQPDDAVVLADGDESAQDADLEAEPVELEA